LAWYALNRRDLPWRNTRDPYRILVSEVMLQQTQVSRVVPKYHEFLEAFPTVQDLAAVSLAVVIRAWKGLGYNRRALNLQRAARVIDEHDWCESKSSTPGVEDYGGCAVGHQVQSFPQTAEELQKLPGIGWYTAGAVATFAFDAFEPAVDTNVRQFIDHWLPSRRARSEQTYYTLAARLIPPDRPAEWLHAVMDFVAGQPELFRLNRRRSRQAARPGSPESFIGSNRYLRGQTIDRLRAAPARSAELYRRVAAPVAVGVDRYGLILEALVHEGLTEKVRSKYQLRER
jgi:A/G-specific adenine glycosylase